MVTAETMKEEKRDMYDFLTLVSEIFEDAKDLDDLKHRKDKMISGINTVYPSHEFIIKNY